MGPPRLRLRRPHPAEAAEGARVSREGGAEGREGAVREDRAEGRRGEETRFAGARADEAAHDQGGFRGEEGGETGLQA